MAEHEDRHAVMITFVIIGLFRGTPAYQHRAGRVHLADHVPGRPGWPAGHPVREIPLMQSHEAIAARIARLVVRAGNVPVEGHRHIEHR